MFLKVKKKYHEINEFKMNMSLTTAISYSQQITINIFLEKKGMEKLNSPENFVFVKTKPNIGKEKDNCVVIK